MTPYETPIIADKDRVIIVSYKLPWQQEISAKTPYILASVADFSKIHKSRLAKTTVKSGHISKKQKHQTILEV